MIVEKKLYQTTIHHSISEAFTAMVYLRLSRKILFVKFKISLRCQGGCGLMGSQTAYNNIVPIKVNSRFIEL